MAGYCQVFDIKIKNTVGVVKKAGLSVRSSVPIIKNSAIFSVKLRLIGMDERNNYT